jgi:hypothetical protein
MIIRGLFCRRILKRLGCKNCQPRARNLVADQLRGKVRLSLNKLRLINEKRFERCFLNFVTNGELIDIFDILHALCGYCLEPNIGLGHYASYSKNLILIFLKFMLMILVGNKNEIHLRQTYSNNFEDESMTIDGFLLNLIFKPLITRLNPMEEYLLMAENFILYSECRAFLIYMKENHGGIFRLTIFSALLDPEKQLKLIKVQKHESRIQVSNFAFIFIVVRIFNQRFLFRMESMGNQKVKKFIRQYDRYPEVCVQIKKRVYTSI